jgi:uncharacterized protein (DUF2141 family)
MRALLPIAFGLCVVAQAADAATLLVRLEGVRPGMGFLKVAVCARSFDEAGCTIGSFRRAGEAVESFVFPDMTPGRYAIAAYQDVNGNGELDKIPPGIPTEPYAFSNDVGRIGPPRFGRALIAVGEGETVVVMKVRPLLGGS